MKDIMPLNMSSSTFSDMKRDLTKIINEAIDKARELNVQKGSVTLKVEFTLDKMPVTTEKEYREAIVPTFKHKVGYAVKVENSMEGEFGGEYELTKDEDSSYGLKTLNGQTSMFDDDDDEDDMDDEE